MSIKIFIYLPLCILFYSIGCKSTSKDESLISANIYEDLLEYLRFDPIGLQPPESRYWDSTTWAKIRRRSDQMYKYIISRRPIDLAKYSFLNEQEIMLGTEKYNKSAKSILQVEHVKKVKYEPEKYSMVDLITYPYPDTVTILNSMEVHPLYLELSVPYFKDEKNAIIFTAINTYRTVFEFRVFYLQKIESKWEVVKNEVLANS